MGWGHGAPPNGVAYDQPGTFSGLGRGDGMLRRMPATDIALWILSVALMAAGVVGAVLPVLPGAALVLAGTVLGAWTDDFEGAAWELAMCSRAT